MSYTIIINNYVLYKICIISKRTGNQIHSKFHMYIHVDVFENNIIENNFERIVSKLKAKAKLQVRYRTVQTITFNSIAKIGIFKFNGLFFNIKYYCAVNITCSS